MFTFLNHSLLLFRLFSFPEATGDPNRHGFEVSTAGCHLLHYAPLDVLQHFRDGNLVNEPLVNFLSVVIISFQVCKFYKKYYVAVHIR